MEKRGTDLAWVLCWVMRAAGCSRVRRVGGVGGERDCGVSVDVPGAQQRSLSRPCPVLGGRRWRRTGPGVCRGGGGKDNGDADISAGASCPVWIKGS